MPLFGNKENRTWDETPLGAGLRAFVYFSGLVWAFLGVSIIADIFMCSIETITSAERKIKGTDVSVKIWNPTVANLTLMALGSSAPEILLSVIEIMSNGFFTGDLGPSTIVGSASFNLLVITAICVAALPDGDTRKIEAFSVFRTTAFFSIFAYVWLLIILMGPWSPDVVELWEALVTFLFFPILVFLAYSADCGWITKFSSRVSPSAQQVIQVGATHYHAYEFSEILRKINSDELTKEEQAELVGKLALQSKNKPSRAVLRRNAIRRMTAQRRTMPNLILDNKRNLKRKMSSTIHGCTEPRVFFSDVNGDINTRFAFLESDKSASLGVMRHPPSGTMRVEWSTRDGTAKGGDDYKKESGVLVFQDQEIFKEIGITLFDDEATEDDEQFYVDLLSMQYMNKQTTSLGAGATAEVTIIDDDEPGEIGFVDDDPKSDKKCIPPVSQAPAPAPDEKVSSAASPVILRVGEACGKATIKVRRMNGSTGDVSCDYETVDITARADVDYKYRKGRLRFKSSEVEKTVFVPIIDTRAGCDDIKQFKIILSNLEGPSRATLSENSTLVVFIEPDKETKALLNDVQKYVEEHQSNYTELGSSSWAAQFKEAILVNGGDSELEAPGFFQYAMHALTLPWKLLFAFVPPTCYAGGWACFFSALLMIGVVTAFIGDLAALFGCQIGLPDTITAITFVALGTSLPDAFASKTAALSDDNADASIGNITGSNSVNVFLGLGLPWTIAAVYWSGGFASDKAIKKWHNKYGGRNNDGSGGSKGPRGARTIGESTAVAFVVPAGDLAVSVFTFVVCGLLCLATLAYRRAVFGAEFGGPKKNANRHAIFFLFLWYET